MGFELVSKIEERFHVKLDLREVLLDSSVSGVANYVRRVLTGGKGTSKAVNLEQECHLDPAISHQEPMKQLHRTAEIFC